MNASPFRRCALLACGLAALAAASACVRPPPRSPNATVYRSALLEEAGVHGSGWRFQPLRPEQQASERAFDAAASACLASSRDRPPAEAQDAKAQAAAVRFCMTQRGFYPSACDDGRDNDDDGKIDHPDDPGCAEPLSIREDPACDDGRDNDGDGLVDWDGGGVAHADPDCDDGARPSEGKRPTDAP